MGKRVTKFFIGAVALLCGPATILAGCQEEEYIRYSRTYYNLFGAAATLQLYGDFSSTSAQNAAITFGNELDVTLSALSSSLSSTDKNSYVTAFNEAEAGATVAIDRYTYEVFTIAYEMYKETGGYFNPAVYYSVDLYGFTARTSGQSAPYDRADASKELPDEEYVTAFQELSAAFANIKLYEEDGKYYAVKPSATVTVKGVEYSLKIDLGGIGKGYTADIADSMIESAGYDCASFNFGSSTMVLKGSYTSEDGCWQLSYLKPRDDDSGEDYYLSVRVRDVALSTSGDYEQYYEIDGTRYCHIINPYTGRPIDTGIITATVLGGTAAEDDARTTAICAMGLQKAVEYINSDAVREEGLKITFVYEAEDGSLYVITNMAEGEYELLDTENYTLGSCLDEDGNVCFTAELESLIAAQSGD